MRPIDKGNAPVDEHGNLIQFVHYQESRPHLLEKLGQYCSYCEMRLESALAVEHVLPKIEHPTLELDWENFLLACPNCNSTKQAKDIHLEDYVWPHLDDTHLTFTYLTGGLIHAVNSPFVDKANNMIALVGLNKVPEPKNTASDRRLQNRRETFGIATKSCADLASFQARPDAISNEFIETFKDSIVTLAAKSGYFSIWTTIFQDNPDMIRRFVEAFPGTSLDCYEMQTYHPKSRHTNKKA